MKTILFTLFTSYLTALLFSCPAWANPALLPHSMVVITAVNQPLQHQAYVRRMIESAKGQFAIYRLNAVDDFEAKMSQGLPANETKARHLFEQRLAQFGKDNFKQQLLAAYQGQLTADQFQIKRYPAIIFDSQWVIYGLTDLKQALQLYQRWVKQQPITRANPDQGDTP